MYKVITAIQPILLNACLVGLSQCSVAVLYTEITRIYILYSNILSSQSVTLDQN